MGRDGQNECRSLIHLLVWWIGQGGRTKTVSKYKTAVQSAGAGGGEMARSCLHVSHNDDRLSGIQHGCVKLRGSLALTGRERERGAQGIFLRRRTTRHVRLSSRAGICYHLFMETLRTTFSTSLLAILLSSDQSSGAFMPPLRESPYPRGPPPPHVAPRPPIVPPLPLRIPQPPLAPPVILLSKLGRQEDMGNRMAIHRTAEIRNGPIAAAR